MTDCQRCGHDSDQHWSPQDPPLKTTACRLCLEGQIKTEGDFGPGYCCMPVSMIKEQP